MSIKNILCAYSGEQAHGSGLEHAIKIAQHHQGWLTGIVSVGRSTLESRYSAHISESLLQEFRETDRKLAQEVRSRFNTVVEKAGLADRTDFVECHPEIDRSLSEYARNFDMTVTGVHSASLSDGHLSASPDLIALQSGRPVLVIPNDYETGGLADHALVAWDGKRAAARAIGDALPILEQKAKVTLLTIGTVAAPDTDVLLRSLGRHGIEADLRLEPRRGTIAKTILEIADEISAKLLVMGAFEHSKFSHSFKGGPTTETIAESKIPVFLSH